MEVWPPDAIVIGALLTFLLAGTIKGTVGIGLPTTSIGIMSQFADPRLSITVAVLPIVAGNAWQLFRSGDALGTLKRYGLFAAFILIVLFITAILAAEVPTGAIVIMLGLVIVAFSLINLVFQPPALPARFDRIGQVAGGISAGILGGLTAIWAPPVAIYLLARRVDRDEFVRATGALFFIGSLPLFAGYVLNGQLSGSTAQLSAALIVPTLAGFTLGELVRKRLDASRFRTAVLVMFLLMGLNLLRRAVFS